MQFCNRPRLLTVPAPCFIVCRSRADVSNKVTVNVAYDSAALIHKYEREVAELKEELAMHDALANRSHVHYAPYSDDELLGV